MRILLHIVAAASLAAGAKAVHAQALSTGSGVVLYGVVDLGLEVSRAGKGTLKREIPGGSLGNRWGLQGSEALGDGLSAAFRLESGFTADNGSLAQGGRGFGRQSWVGLSQDGIGTLALGRHQIPYVDVQFQVDAFRWMGNGGFTAITRSGAALQQLLPIFAAARADNAVKFTSAPWLGGLKIAALVAAGEGSPQIGRTYSLSGNYTNKSVDIVAGWARQLGANNSNGAISSFVLGGSVDIGPARLYAGVTDERNSCLTCTGALARGSGITSSGDSAFRLLNLGVRIPFGNATVVTQVVRIQDRSDYAAPAGDRDATWFAVGAEYLLSKRTNLYASVGTVGNKNGSLYALGSGGAQQAADFVGSNDPRASAMVVGIRHSF